MAEIYQMGMNEIEPAWKKQGKWFAWYPVKADDGKNGTKTVWLSNVWRWQGMWPDPEAEGNVRKGPVNYRTLVEEQRRRIRGEY